MELKDFDADDYFEYQGVEDTEKFPPKIAFKREGENEFTLVVHSEGLMVTIYDVEEDEFITWELNVSYAEALKMAEGMELTYTEKTLQNLGLRMTVREM